MPKAPFWVWIDGELMLARNTTGPIDEGGVKASRVEVIRGSAPGNPRWGATPRAHIKGAAVTMSRVAGVYVHAKSMMIDDTFVSIGSANLNRRGFFSDGEINIFAIPEQLRAAPDNPARALRTRLWAEHLGIPPAMGAVLARGPDRGLRALPAIAHARQPLHAAQRDPPANAVHDHQQDSDPLCDRGYCVDDAGESPAADRRARRLSQASVESGHRCVVTDGSLAHGRADLMPIFANAIPQVEPPLVGIHLLWNGPHPWVYSPTGWIIQRRDWNRRLRLDCLTLSPSELATLRARRELRIRFGALTDRAGECPTPLVAAGAGPTGGVILTVAMAGSRATAAAGVVASRAASAGTAASFAASTIGLPTGCEIITLELDLPQSYVRVFADAHGSFAVALRDGKVVAGGPEVAGSGFHELAAEGIDTVVVYARSLTGITWCVRKDDDGEDGWDDVPVLARLQLPIRPLMPLANAAAELAEARSRLLPGETIEADEFAHLADLIRGLIEAHGAARPIDRTLLLKSDEEIDPEETAALDPLRSVLPHPTWRRALGFAWFDRDPALVPGAVYEYRLTAGFPAKDLADAVYGFHTVPAETPLPSDFYLHDLRIRLPQSSRVERFDAAAEGGKPVYTRHGVSLSPDRLPFWLGEEIDGWSAVIDLPGPSKNVILDLRGTHALKFAAGAPWLPWPPGMQDVPAGEHVTLSFPAEIHQLRLSGKGFLCGIRIPAAPAPPDGIQPIPTVLPPVTLVNTPRPGAPLSAGISNLQAPQPVASNDIPEALAPPKQQLGFEVRWRPAPIDGITIVARRPAPTAERRDALPGRGTADRGGTGMDFPDRRRQHHLRAPR